MLFEFFAQVVHCDSLVSFLNLERTLIIMTLKLTRMMVVVIFIKMVVIFFGYRILKERLCQLTHLVIVVKAVL